MLQECGIDKGYYVAYRIGSQMTHGGPAICEEVWETVGLPVEADMSPDTVVLAMRAHAQPAPSLERDRRVEIQLVDARYDDATPVAYTATLGPTGCEVDKGAAESPDARVVTDSRTWQHVLFGRTTIRKAITARRLTISPDNADSRRLAADLVRACGVK